MTGMKDTPKGIRSNFLRFRLLRCMLCSMFVLVSLFGACIDVPTEKTTFEEELTVHCMLRAGWGPSRVHVERTLDIEEPESDIAVSGATVLLFGNGEEIQYNEIPSDPGVYHPAGHIIIQNDSTYTLDVSDPGGRSVSATTTVPGHFQIISPSFGDTLRLGNDIRFTWTGSEGAEEYRAHITLNLYGEGIDNGLEYISYTLSDTTLIIPTVRVPVEADCWIDVYAVDVNYAGYTRADSEDPDAPDVNHIPGAKGVFGSMANTFGLFYVR